MQQIKIPPNNAEAEQSVIGSILLDPKSISKVSRIISPEDFYDLKYQTIFSFMQKMQGAMQAVDLTTLAAALEEGQKMELVGGSHILAGAMNSVASASNVEHYAKTVKKLSTLRKLIIAGYQIQELGYKTDQESQNALQEAGKLVLSISDSSQGENLKAAQILTEYEQLQMRYEGLKATGKRILGHSTGFEQLDEMTQGIREEHLWLLGGATSAGKTYFSLNIVKALLEQNLRVVYYSLEMSRVDMISRMLAVITDYPPQYILKGQYQTEFEAQIVDEAKQFLYNSDFTVYSEMSNLDQIKLSMIEEAMKGKVDCFFLDFAQLVTRTGKEYDDMRAVATEFQALMKQLKTPMIMLSQLSNEAVKSPNSLVSGFKGAGNLAQAADFGIELWQGETDVETYRDKLQRGVPAMIKCQIKKNRHGRAGTVPMLFTSYTGKFEE